ncbi:MAG: hypothetical protein NTY20_01225 [Candidatus Aenigmarchaeota archaeon]|nr:hypothetical protein [Candidatus Aenigmarchaeota archaeon]
MFDLYKLSGNEGKGSIRAIFTRELKKEFLESVKEIRSKVKLREFCENIGIGYTTFWDYSNRRESVPLFLLKELESISERKFKIHVQCLEAGTGPTKSKAKVVGELSEKLAKIIGAYAADGNLRMMSTDWNGKKVTHYELVFREEFESNAKALVDWLSDVFGIKPKIREEKNHYCVYISNKIVFRYFTDVFGLDPGRKTEIVSAPEFVKNSSQNIKKSFITVVLMFDGSVSYRNGYVELCSRSRRLAIDTAFILNEIGIEPDYTRLEPDGFGRYRIGVRKFGRLEKCLELFEAKTEKWWRLKEHLYGFDGKTKSLNILIANLDEHYPKKRKSTLSIAEIVKSVALLQNRGVPSNFSSIAESLNKSSTVIYEYLRKLERLEILKTERYGQGKIWLLSEEFPFPKRGD